MYIDEKEYSLGYKAYFDGFNRNDNPYDEILQGKEFVGWNDGWLSADSDADDN